MRNIRKKAIAVFLGAAAAATLSAAAYADGITVIADNEVMAFDTEPFIDDGTTLVPMRAIFERLGAKVGWDGDTRTVTAKTDSVEISLEINSKTMLKNGGTIELRRPAVIVNDRTCVPLRAVSEAFGAKVEWDGDTQTVIIETAVLPDKTPAATASPEATKRPIITPQPLREDKRGKNPIASAVVKEYPQRTGANIYCWFNLKPESEIPDEVGVIIADSKAALSSDNTSIAVAYPEDVSVDLGTVSQFSGAELRVNIDLKESGAELRANKTYYYQVYIVSSGVRYLSQSGHFTTTDAPKGFDALDGAAEDITSDNAVLKGELLSDDIGYDMLNQSMNVGFYLGKDKNSMERFGEPENGWGMRKNNGGVVGNKSGSIIYRCDINGDLGVELEPETEYFWKFSILWGSEEFTSETKSFTTE